MPVATAGSAARPASSGANLPAGVEEGSVRETRSQWRVNSSHSESRMNTSIVEGMGMER